MSSLNCVRCNKPLILVKCFICGVRARTRVKGLKPCSACGGRGITYVCPDYYAHNMEDYYRKNPRVRKIVRDVNRKIKVQKVSKPTVKKNIIDLNRVKKLPPPSQNIPPYWHPSYPGRAFKRARVQAAEQARQAAEQARQAAEQARQAAQRARRKRPF
jgi:hypothetical protein